MRHNIEDNQEHQLTKDNQVNIRLKILIDNMESEDEMYIEPGLPRKRGKYISVKKHDVLINYNSGMTTHYKDNRVIREQELERLLGKGKPVGTFLIHDEKSGLQIQEILDNGIIVVYSFASHKKITLFAPTTNRICQIYEATGEITPEELILKSEDNVDKGYNEIFCM